MKKFYLPVPTAEAIELVEAWNPGRVAKNKAEIPGIECRFTGYAKFRKRNQGRGDLANVSASDNLIIIMHGLKPRAHLEDHSYPAVSVGMSRGATKVHGGLLEPDQWVGGNQKSTRLHASRVTWTWRASHTKSTT